MLWAPRASSATPSKRPLPPVVYPQTCHLIVRDSYTHGQAFGQNTCLITLVHTRRACVHEPFFFYTSALVLVPCKFLHTHIIMNTYTDVCYNIYIYISIYLYIYLCISIYISIYLYISIYIYIYIYIYICMCVCV